MIKESIRFGYRKMTQNLSNSLFIVLGLGITVATIVLLYTILVTNENPNNKFINADRLIINNNSMRYTEENDWGSNLNYRLIKEAIESISDLEERTIYRETSHSRWVNGERYKSYMLYTDHRMVKFINFKWIKGGFFSETDLKNENRVILLSEKSAVATFGTRDAIGKYCEVFDEKFRVIGVYQNVPDHTFSLDEIIPLTTDEYKNRETEMKESSFYYNSLVMVKRRSDIEPVKQQMHANAALFPSLPEHYTLALFPHTINDQLYTDRKATPKWWSYNEREYANFINSLILIFILGVICFVNVTNLTLTNFINRNIEMGVRVSFGASWKDVLLQGIMESFLYFSFSFMVGLTLSQLFLSVLNTLDLYVNYVFELNLGAILIVAIYTFTVPFIAHLISCKKIVGKNPVSLLKGVAL